MWTKENMEGSVYKRGIKSLKINKEDALVRGKLRIQIWGTEWDQCVQSFSGTGSPRLSWKERRKTVIYLQQRRR